MQPDEELPMSNVISWAANTAGFLMVVMNNVGEPTTVEEMARAYHYLRSTMETMIGEMPHELFAAGLGIADVIEEAIVDEEVKEFREQLDEL